MIIFRTNASSSSGIGHIARSRRLAISLKKIGYQVSFVLDYKNDFPGVALESELEFWKMICPNPNLLFKLDSLSKI